LAKILNCEWTRIDVDNDLETLKTAKDEAQKKVQKDPSKQNLDAFEKATKMLAEYMAGDSEPAFDNRLEAHGYLRRLG